MRARLKQQTWITPLVFAGLVAIFGWWGNARLRDTVKNQLEAKLKSTLDANVTALEIWTTNQTALATSIADDMRVSELATKILESPVEAAGEMRRSADRSDARDLNIYLQRRLSQLGYEIAQLVNTNFIDVANLGARGFFMPPGQPVSEAHTNKFAELFASGQPILITPYRPEPPSMPPSGRRGRRNEPPPGTQTFGAGATLRSNGPFGEAFNRGGPPPFEGRGFRRGRGANPFSRRLGDRTLMQVAAPIRDSERVVRGALALVINPTNEFTRILSVAKSGKSGETYAFDQTGLLISQSRFDEQLKQIRLLDETNSSSALNLRLHDPGGDLTGGFKLGTNDLSARPLTHLVAEAVTGEDGVDLQPSRDYRGVPVVGAWHWLPELGFGIATQIDADEAFRPLRVLQLLFIALFLLLVLCAMGMLLFSYANVNWRRRLSEAELKLKQLGQYTLEEKIGEGGMGVVYRARHALMRRQTAVKLLMPDRADDASVRRFEREVCLTCQLTHPNTIQVYDYGRTPEGIFYYAMEFLRGLNLHQLVTRFGPQPEGRTAYILIQICDSLAEAHSMGLVHRDIKPANVFLSERGGVPDSVKVLDFGLVREYGGRDPDAMRVTSAEGFVGTPSFMAPEAVKDSTKSDPRSDIYSVGVLAYFLMTGKYVYDGRSVMEIYEQQLTVPPPRLSQLTTHLVSPQFENAIMRCINKDPAVRPQSASELRQLLQASPLLAQWQPDARAAWWAEHRAQIQAMSETGAESASPIPTVKIDFETRIK